LLKVDLFGELQEITARKKRLREQSELLMASKQARLQSVIAVGDGNNDALSTITSTTTPRSGRFPTEGNCLTQRSTDSEVDEDENSE
jgi:hypothetical protein